MGGFHSLLRYMTGHFNRSVSCACGCYKGKVRSNNEDNFCFDGVCLTDADKGLPKVLTARISGEGLKKGTLHGFGIFDGMGGGDYGEVASGIAAGRMKDFLNKAASEGEMHKAASIDELHSDQLHALCGAINKEVYQVSVDRGSYLVGTTMAALFIDYDSVWACNIGDSRIFRLRRHELEQISIDHTDEKIMKAVGVVGRKPMLTQYLGMNTEEYELEPCISQHRIQKNDEYLICSDGVTDMVPEEQIRKILDSGSMPEDMVKKLIESALDAGGRDNITAVVLAFE